MEEGPFSDIFNSNIFGGLRDILLSLIKNELVFKDKKDGRKCIKLCDKDVLGSYFSKVPKNTHSDDYESYTLNIAIFTRFKKNGIQYRNIKKICLHCKKKDSLQIMEKWNIAIHWLGAELIDSVDIWDCINNNKYPPSKNILAVINPHSGNGNTNYYFHSCVKPYFNYRKIQCKVNITNSFNDLLEIGAQLDTEKYQIIVVLGGDGTLHGIVNGIYKNDPTLSILKNISFVNFIGGSSNGIISSAYNEHKLGLTGENIIYSIFKGKKFDASLTKVKVRSFHLDKSHIDKEFISLLSVTWGLVSDIDIDSDNHKWLGSFRHTLCGIKNIFCLKRNPAHIYIIPDGDNRPFTYEPFEEDKADIWEKYSDSKSSFATIVGINKSNITASIIVNEECGLCDQGLWLLTLDESSTFWNVVKVFLASNFKKSYDSLLENRKNAFFSLKKISKLLIKSNTGSVMVDGELIHSGAFILFQESLPNTIKVLLPC